MPLSALDEIHPGLTLADYRYPPATSDLERNKTLLREQGVCIHKGALTPIETERLRARLEEQAEMERELGVALLGLQSHQGKRWIGGVAPGEKIPPWQAVSMLLNKGRAFVGLMMHPTLLAYAEDTFGETPYLLSSLGGLLLRRGAEPMAVHADQQFTPYRTEGPLFINFMICLSPFTEAMGATRFIPYSHRWSHYPAVGLDPETGVINLETIPTVGVECEPGDVIAFDSRIWHQSGHHQSDQVRYAITAMYCQFWVRPMDNYVQSLHDDVLATFDDAQKSMVGFRPLTCGRFEPRQPGDRKPVNRTAPYVPMLTRQID